MSAKTTFWALLIVGMGLRLLWASLVPVVPVSDSGAYDQFARTLVEHGVYGWSEDNPTAYWAVGTSALTAFTYLFTESYAGVVLLNLLAGLAAIVLTFGLAARWFDERTALCAMALVAFWPNLIFFTTILSSELFFIAGTLAGLVFWQRPSGHTLLNLVLAGLIWGGTAYIRPVILLVPLALTLVDLPKGLRRFALTGAQAAAVTALILLVALPWSLRNQQVFGERIFISSNFGTNFWMGNNPESNGGYMPLPPETQDMDELERNEYLEARAKEFIQNNPLQAVGLLGKKLVALIDRETIGVVWNKGFVSRASSDVTNAAKIVATGYWYLLLLGGFAGIALVWRRHGLIAAFFNPPVALWGYFTSLHVVIVGGDRYHMPSSPFIAIMAAVSLAAAMEWKRTRPVTADRMKAVK